MRLNRRDRGGPPREGRPPLAPLGLDPVEQALQPADELSLSDPQFGLARYLVLGERQGQPLKFLDKLRCQPVLKFLDRTCVDLLEPCPALLVQWGSLDLFE